MCNQDFVPRYKIDKSDDRWFRYATFKSHCGWFGKTVWRSVDHSDCVEKLKERHVERSKLPIYL